MLGLDSLKQFYFLPELHDMRCGANRIMETVRIKYGRYPYKGDVFIYMSKNRRRVRLVHYENHAFYFHEKTFEKAYKFMKLEADGGDNLIYSIAYNDLVMLLECPVIDVMKVRSRVLRESI
ncbi:MAG: IS66 family insertion sequence element accessory protein TnpB [Muribaculum sp.]|nr:IS66 family insertion sequence element accessory protein TnpB [Muribaculum sp.]